MGRLCLEIVFIYWGLRVPSGDKDKAEETDFKFLLVNLPLYALASLPAVCEELAQDAGQG